MSIPQDLGYSTDHEWAKVQGDTATIGITKFAVEQLGDITLVELPEIGAAVTAGEAIGVVESVKAVSDLYTPLSGAVVEVNQSLEDSPELVNEDPYGQGWMIKITLGNAAEADALMDSTAYADHLKSLAD